MPRQSLQRHIVVPPLAKQDDGGGEPRVTNWETEQLHELADQQLKELGRWLTRSTSSRFDPLLDADSVSNLLFEPDAARVFQANGISVQRSQQQDAAHQSLPSELESLRQAHTWSRSKFKIIRIRKGVQSSFSTTAYVHLSGHRTADDGFVEINATWNITWRMQADGVPRIQSIDSREFELVSLSGGRMFHDITDGVIGGTDVYADCIVRSIGALRKRMEHRLGVYNLGHHGIAIGDVNGDDLPDAYVCQTGGVPNHLFVQGPDGSATEAAKAWNIDYLDNTRAALLIDLDNDGDEDLVLTLSTGMLILENSGPAGFRERARIRSVEQGFSLSAADFNADGLLDIYVCGYYGAGATVSELPVPVPYFDATNGGENHLIVNEGGWRFRDGTAETHLDQDNSRFSFASAWDDFDNDGDMDLLVVNDFGPNQLFRNTDGRFRNDAPALGLVDGAFGMSASFGDVNRDGYSDIYVANMFSAAGNRITTQERFKPELDENVRKKFLHLARGNSLFVSTGDGFKDVSVASGVTVGRWSWGSLFADVNNDGWEDLLVGNGYLTGESKDDL